MGSEKVPSHLSAHVIRPCLFRDLSLNIAMITCITGKKAYQTQELAEDALLEAWTRYNYTPSNGPVAVYHCDDCGLYHFTSKGDMNGKLAKYLAGDEIRRRAQAGYWEDKLKDR